MKSILTRIIYTLILYLLIPLELMRLFWRGRIAPDYRRRWLERFAIALPPVKKGGIWIHTVSVGETLAALPVIRHLIEHHPEQSITVTTMTPTGSERVCVELGDRVYHVYVPYDVPDAAARFLHHVQPKQLLIMETELWPNIIAAAKSNGVDIILMNARLSARSAKRYLRFKSFIQTVLNQFSVIAAQHKDDAQRFIELGAKDSQVKVTGNIKYDLTIESSLIKKAESLRAEFPAKLVWIAASTHRGEEQPILEAHQLIRKQYPDAQLIIVPRHPERFDEVAELCANQGFSYTRRSLEQATNQPVYVGDTMGELVFLFAVADIAFVGGSFVKTGGHNLLEPAALSKPVLTGPYDFNFRDVNQQMLASNAAVCVETSAQLAEQVIQWHNNPEAMKLVGENGLSVVKNNQGALKKLLTLINTD